MLVRNKWRPQRAFIFESAYCMPGTGPLLALVGGPPTALKNLCALGAQDLAELQSLCVSLQMPCSQASILHAETHNLVREQDLSVVLTHACSTGRAPWWNALALQMDQQPWVFAVLEAPSQGEEWVVKSSLELPAKPTTCVSPEGPPLCHKCWWPWACVVSTSNEALSSRRWVHHEANDTDFSKIQVEV